MPKPVILDVNAIIHFVQAFDMQKFNIIAQTLNNNQCFIPEAVITETIYVLDSVFHVSREIISLKLKDFISIQDNLLLEKNIIIFALNLYASSKLDFVDCLLAGYARVNKNQIFTFDNDLKRELAEQVFRLC